MPTCEARFRAIAADCAVQFESAIGVFLTSHDPDGPHKARVSLRRMTTAIDAFAPILRHSRAQRLRSRIKRQFRYLGQVRDSDVFLLEHKGSAGHRRRLKTNRQLRDRIRKRLKRARAERLVRDIADLGRPDTRAFRRSAAALAARHQPVSGLAIVILGQAWQDCLDYGDAYAAIPAGRRHDFRKTIKTLRYLDEFLGGYVPGPGHATFRRALRLLQDDLGTLNDAAVARVVRDLPRVLQPTEKTGFAEDRASRNWADLAGSPTPWQSGRETG
jgi:CHAD domain-containing protein